MQATCSNSKDTKHLDKQPTVLNQLFRAFRRYPDCDKRRTQPCREYNEIAQKA